MMYFLLFIGIIIVLGVIKFLIDYKKELNSITARGGMKVVYETLIDGLLTYNSAKITYDKRNVIVIGGTFTDVCGERGVWGIRIVPTFRTLNVRFQGSIEDVNLAGIMINGKTTWEKIEKAWEFPVDADQTEILTAVTKFMDEILQGFGVYA